MTKKYSIYICDDHRLFLESIEVFISLQEKYHCIGHAETVEHAFQDVVRLKPDLILIDYHLNESNGLELLEKIKQAAIPSLCLILTMRRDINIRNRALELGAKGYLLKTIGAEEMLRVFDLITGNKRHFYDSIEVEKVTRAALPEKQLTEREIEIARLVCRELSSEKISETLHLSLHTINTHRKNILKKINAKNAIDLMNYMKEKYQD
jgi:DNA-binding NarL/FixJ family response regulator